MFRALGAIWESITGKEGGNNAFHHPLNGLADSSSSSIILQMGFEPRSDDEDESSSSSSSNDDDEEEEEYDPAKQEQNRFARRLEFTKLCIVYIERFFGRPLTYDSDFLCNMIQDPDTQGWLIPDSHPIFLMLSTSRSFRPLRILTAPQDVQYFVYDELVVRQAISKTCELFVETQPLHVVVETSVFKLAQEKMPNTKVD